MPKILVVENEVPMRSALKSVLESEGYVIEVASDGRQACDILAASDMDLVISDIQMPFMDGLELLKWTLENKKVPVVLMTGFSHIVETQQAYDLGAKGFLTKPFEQDQLKHTIETVFEGKREKQEVINVDSFFCKVPIDEFLTGTQIQFNIYVRITQFKYIKISNKGEDISRKKIGDLKMKDFHYLYLKRNNFHSLVGFANPDPKEHVKKINAVAKKEFIGNMGKVISEYCYVTGIDKSEFLEAKSFVETCIEALSNDEEILNLLLALNSHSKSLFFHSLGVSTIAVMITRKMKWQSMKTAFKVCLAGLFHDIGKIEIDPEILKKERFQLNQSERKLYETHPSRGKELLESIKSMPSDIKSIVFEHHEMPLGQGYPRGTSDAHIHPLARLVATANIFCNYAIRSEMTDIRTDAMKAFHVNKMSAMEAVKKMNEQDGHTLAVESFTALKNLIRVKNRSEAS